MKRHNRKTFPPKNPPSKKSSARTCICKTKKSEKPPLHLGRRFAPPAPIFGIPTQVLSGLHYTTKFEPFSSTRASRALRARGVFVLDCTIRFRADSLGRASTPRPRPPPRRQSSPPKADRHAHLFRGGFLKIEWAAGVRMECMKIRKTLRAVLERSEQKSRKVYCSCKIGRASCRERV